MSESKVDRQRRRRRRLGTVSWTACPACDAQVRGATADREGETIDCELCGVSLVFERTDARRLSLRLAGGAGRASSLLEVEDAPTATMNQGDLFGAGGAWCGRRER